MNVFLSLWVREMYACHSWLNLWPPQKGKTRKNKISALAQNITRLHDLESINHKSRNRQSSYLRQLWTWLTGIFSPSTILSTAGNAANRCTILRQSSRSLNASMNFGYLIPKRNSKQTTANHTKQALGKLKRLTEFYLSLMSISRV